MASSTRGLWLKRIGLGLIGLLAVAQLVRPERANPPVESERALERVAPSSALIQSTLRRSCYDCHSQETRWPWYSQVAPVSWMLAKHVRDGRRHLNFSDWVLMTTGRKKKVVGDICDEVKDGGMPLSSYLWIHGDARLTPADVNAICEWTAGEVRRLASATGTNP